MPEPGRLISFRVANGEEAPSALLDALTELCWSGKNLVKKQVEDAAEGSQLLQKHADPINGMDFLVPAGDADTAEITENEALALALALGEDPQEGNSLDEGDNFMNRLTGLSTDITVAQCGEVSRSAEMLLRAFSRQLLRRRKRCLVLDSAAVEQGQIAKRLGEAVWAAQQHPVVIIVNRATSFSKVFSDVIVPAVLQDSLNLLQPLHVALLITSQPYLSAVSQYRAAVEASSSLDVEVHWEPAQKHTFSLRLKLQQQPDSPIEVEVLGHEKPFTVLKLHNWIRDELSHLFAHHSWQQGAENLDTVRISLDDLSPPLLAGTKAVKVMGQVGLAVSSTHVLQMELHGMMTVEWQTQSPGPIYLEAISVHLQGADVDLAALIAEAVTPAGPLAGFCEEPGLIFKLQANTSLTQGPSQEAASVQLDRELEDEIPDNGIQSNQLAIATELMRRLLLIYSGSCKIDETEAEWFQRSVDELRQQYFEGLEFVILTPSFKTLRQQTFDRLLKAGLADTADEDCLVVPYIWAHKTAISNFHESVRNGKNRLHVMVVDECHYAATLGQAHDAFVNEFKWQSADGADVWGPCKGPECKRHRSAGAILNQENLITLLVSATPYCVLSQQSRIPAEEVQLQDSTAEKVERNVVDWNLCLQHFPTHYWSIEKYLQTCHKTKQLQHAVICDHQFDIKLARARQHKFSGDHSLLVEYILSLEFFRFFRANGQDLTDHWSSDQSDRVNQMLQEVELILGKHLWQLAWRLLQMQVSPQLDWVRSEFESVKRRSDITLPPDEQAAQLQQEGEQSQPTLPATPSMVLRLKLLIFYKLKGEKELHLRKGDRKADDEVFNQTDRIVKDLLDGTGNMVVIRVSSAAVGQEFAAVIRSLLEVQQLQDGEPLFECVGDFGSSDNQPLVNKMSHWAMQRKLSLSHPANSIPDFAALSELPGASLQNYLDWKSQALLSGAPAALQYGDLHGVPMMLVLCEKGRMGDTFPQTFRCLDLRLRTSENFTTFVQELGRLCRYPTATGTPESPPLKLKVSQQGGQTDHESCLEALEEALVYMYGRVLEPHWRSWAKAIALACSRPFARLMRALNHQAARLHAASQVLLELKPFVRGLTDLPGANEEVEALAASGQSIWDLLRDCFDQLWPQDGDLLRRHLRIVKQTLLDWRHCVLDTLEATGFRHNDRFAAQLSSHGRAARLQLDGVYVQDVQDAQDLACAFLQPDSSLRAAMQAGVDCQVQLIRFDHMVPYAVVKIKSHKQIRKAMDLQMAQHWGQTEGQTASDTVLDNIPSAGQLDRFVDRAKGRIKGAKRGLEVHKYRENYIAGTTSYDNWGSSVEPAGWLHQRRLLLKAEPQVGKTGAYIAFLLRLKEVLSCKQDAAPVMLERLTKSVEPVARLRWLHPAFEDMAEEWQPTYYGDVLSGRYAGKVALQRAMLLARACETPSGLPWPEYYGQLMKGWEGENIQVKRGIEMIFRLAETLRGQRKPVHLSDKQLIIDNFKVFEQAINWDRRLDQLMKTLHQLDIDPSIQVNFDKTSHQISSISVLSQQIYNKLWELCTGTSGRVQHNLVQLLKWPSAADYPDAEIRGNAAGSASTSTNFEQPHLARSLQLARFFSPHAPAVITAGLRMREYAINWQDLTPTASSMVWPEGPPKLWASKEALNALRKRGEISAAGDTGSITFQRGAQQQKAAVAHWIFVPSYRRYAISDPKQMLVDWSNAMKDMFMYISYTRVIVVRPGEDQEGYCKMLEDYQQLQQQQQGEALQKQVTLLLEMPPKIGVAAAAELVGASAGHLQSPVQVELGIGYARLCAQLTAYFMGMDAAWLLDDNVQGCYRLSYEDLLLDTPQPPSRLQNIQIGEAMQILEDHVKRTSDPSSKVVASAEDVSTLASAAGCTFRDGKADTSPRSTQLEGVTHIKTVADWSGGWSNYGMLGVNQSFQWAHKVGMEIRPWKVSHSLFSMVLMNVKATVEKGAFYPAKPYHEDIDFPHICNDHQLVAAKCQWLFVRKKLFRSTSEGALSQAAPELIVMHPGGDLYTGQVIKVQLVQETEEPPTELWLGSTRVASLMVPVVASEIGNHDHIFLACLDSPAEPGEHRLVTNLRHSTGANVHYHGQRMIQWSDSHEVDQHYVPDGRPVPRELAFASRKVQLDSMLDFLAQQKGDAQVINAYDSSEGARWDQLGAAELHGRFERLHLVKQLSASVFYFVDDPRFSLDRVLVELRAAVGRLRATAVPHWLAIQAGPHRISTADLADLQRISDSSRWQLDAVWSTAPPGQCCKPIMEAGSDDDTVQDVELYPYLLLALRCSAADHKAPSRQSSGARNDLSPSCSVEASTAKPPRIPAKDVKRKLADAPVDHAELKKGKGKKQKRVHGNELEVAERGGGRKSPTEQDSAHRTSAGPEAAGGAGKASQLTDAGGSGQVAGKPRALIRAELEKSRVPTSFKTLEQVLGVTLKQVRDNSRVREGKRPEKTSADGVKTRKTVYTDFARDSGSNVLLRSWLVTYPTPEAPGNPVWFSILGLTERHRLPWERAAGSGAVAPPQQEEDLDTRLMGELQHFGVVAQIVVRLDPSDTAWVKFVDICASAEAGLITLGNNNDVHIERCDGPPV